MRSQKRLVLDHGKLIFSGYSPWQVIITVTPAPTSIRWRDDARCGPDFPLEDGSPAECNPNSSCCYCCSASGWCGDTPQHCSCDRCINYREEYSGDAQPKSLKDVYLEVWSLVSDLCGTSKIMQALIHNPCDRIHMLSFLNFIKFCHNSIRSSY